MHGQKPQTEPLILLLLKQGWVFSKVDLSVVGIANLREPHTEFWAVEKNSKGEMSYSCWSFWNGLKYTLVNAQ